MNKKFKYKKSLLAAILSATLLAGCDGGGSGSSSDTPPVDSGTGSLPEVKPDPTPNPEPTPEPTPDPEPTPEPTPDPEPTPEPEPEPVPTKTGYLTLGGSLRVPGLYSSTHRRCSSLQNPGNGNRSRDQRPGISWRNDHSQGIHSFSLGSSGAGACRSVRN